MKKITVNHKEYTMPKIDVDTYMEYLDLREQTEKKSLYNRADIEAMTLFIVKAYGGQFTAEELKNREGGLTAAELIMEFQFIDMQIANEMKDKMKKLEKLEKNFTESK